MRTVLCSQRGQWSCMSVNWNSYQFICSKISLGTVHKFSLLGGFGTFFWGGGEGSGLSSGGFVF